MLPNLRAVFAATLAALALLTLAFGAVATFRVAQGQHGVLQADLVQRARTIPPPKSEPRIVMVIDTPGPHLAPPPALPVVNVREVPVGAEVADTPVALAPPSPPSPAPDVVAAPTAPLATEAPPAQAEEPPIVVAAPRENAVPAPEVARPPLAIGGPLAAPKPQATEAERAAARAERAKKLAAAKRARAARLARQRKIAAARRAAAEKHAREQQHAQQPANAFNTGFGNSSFGGTFKNTFGNEGKVMPEKTYARRPLATRSAKPAVN